MSNWDPKQYLRFERERTQPCIDLVNRIDLPKVEYAADLGCGPGNSTQVLARHFPDAEIVGIDSSKQMIERARIDRPEFVFEVADAAKWEADQPCDVILSNACFQWLGEHEKLFPRLMNQLTEGGQLAVQMPRNFEAPVHKILRSLATSPPFNAKIDQREPYWVKEAGFYYDILRPVSSQLELWETEYVHVLDDHDAIIEWYKGTGMRPYLEPLDAGEQMQFIDRCREELVKAYPKQSDGRVLFPFLRIFFVATK
jgi:trans-aconitate 2-methyltransferase